MKNFNNEFEKKYFDILVKNSQYLKTNPLNCKVNEFNKIIEVLKNNENLKRNFEVLYEKYNLLNNEEKLIKLLELTRSIYLNKFQKSFFMPIMDFVNYHHEGLSYSNSKDGNVYLKSTKHIKKKQEILINYTEAKKEITFLFGQGFVDKN